jgi:hypothetical protein
MWNTTAGKYAVVLSALALASFSAPARAGARFGLEVGANVSSLRYTDANGIISAFGWDPGWRASFTGGASVEFPWRRTVSVMTGLRYVQQGDKVEFGTSPPVSSLTGEFRISQNYLAVPLLLAFRPFPSPRCFLAAGPEGAVLLSGKASTEFSGEERLGHRLEDSRRGGARRDALVGEAARGRCGQRTSRSAPAAGVDAGALAFSGRERCFNPVRPAPESPIARWP